MWEPFEEKVVELLQDILDQVKEIKNMASSDPLAGISQSVSDLTAAVNAFSAVVAQVVSALQAAAAGNGFSPTEAAALASSIESQVSSINAGVASESGALPPPPPAAAAEKAKAPASKQ